jgi:phosphopantetheinyl transferase
MIALGPRDIHVWRFGREIGGAAAIRGACRHYLGGAVDVHRSPLGKPFVPGAPLEVAVAHASGATMVAIARGVLGIDAERSDPLPDLDPLRARTLAPAEDRELEATPLALREARFYRCWVRKEALLKARGCGLAVDPREVDTTQEAPGWHWLDATVAGNIAVAIATVEPQANLAWHFT